MRWLPQHLLTLEFMFMPAKVVRMLRLILRVLLSLAFLAAAVPKFLPQSGWRERFAEWGYPAWFVLVIGVLEVAGVAGLWIPRVSRHALVLLVIIMLGAVSTNLTHPPTVEALRPAIFLAFLVVLLVLQEPARSAS